MPSSPESSSKELELDESSEILNTVEKLKARLTTKDPELADKMIPEVIPGSPDVHMKRMPQANNKHISEDGLILPRKPANPVLESSEHHNLQRELLFNKKIGKNVLNQKSELQRALEKHKDAQIRKDLEKQIEESTPELERAIADRAKRLQEPVSDKEEDKSLSKEFLEARAKLRTRHDSK